MLSGKIKEKIIYSSEDKKKVAIHNINKVKHQIMKINRYKMTKNINFESIIPLKIYQTWHTKDLPLNMKICTDSIKNMHPNFEYFLFDDDDCRNFIIKHFDNNVIEAFDSLIPGAYKADLWRYCVLYINGGIYLDIKYKCINGFNFIELTEKEPLCSICFNEQIQYAIIPCGHTFCTTCIKRHVVNCSVCRGQIRDRVRVYFK